MAHWTKELRAENETLKRALAALIRDARDAVESRAEKERLCPSGGEYGRGYAACAREAAERLQGAISAAYDVIVPAGIDLPGEDDLLPEVTYSKRVGFNSFTEQTVYEAARSRWNDVQVRDVLRISGNRYAVVDKVRDATIGGQTYAAVKVRGPLHHADPYQQSLELEAGNYQLEDPELCQIERAK